MVSGGHFYPYFPKPIFLNLGYTMDLPGEF